MVNVIGDGMVEPINITIETIINASIEIVWQSWNDPKHIVKWNHASGDWHSPKATNDFKVDGKFMYRMEANDGSYGFDFSGTYLEIKKNELIVTRLDDNRLVKTEFIQLFDRVKIIETFEAEDENTITLQKEGWSKILNNFSNYTENLAKQTNNFIE